MEKILSVEASVEIAIIPVSVVVEDNVEMTGTCSTEQSEQLDCLTEAFTTYFLAVLVSKAH